MKKEESKLIKSINYKVKIPYKRFHFNKDRLLYDIGLLVIVLEAMLLIMLVLIKQ